MSFISRILTHGCPCFPKKFESRPSASISDVEGGFEQMVHIYSCVADTNLFKRGVVLIDPCNNGPNLATEAVIQSVHGRLIGPGMAIEAYDGKRTTTDGQVELCFSGLCNETGRKKRHYTETFHCVPHISDGIDMILNYNFYMRHYKDKVPGVLMIRTVKKETKEQKRQREEREKKQDEEARKQAATRREEKRTTEESRRAQQAGNHHANHSSQSYSGSSSSYNNRSNGY